MEIDDDPFVMRSGTSVRAGKAEPVRLDEAALHRVHHGLKTVVRP